MRTDLSKLLATAIFAGSALATVPAHAHIKLIKPASWLNEDDSGGPQKGAPCGPGGYDDVMPIPMSGMVSTFKAGEKVTVEWEVTIPHPGWYRIALAKDRADLTDPDIEFDLLCNVDEMSVPTTAHGNVLADGLYMNSSETHFSHEVTMPNEPCDKCTLQVIQFMELHPPPCIYYHCADIKIEGSSGNQSDGGTSSSTQTDAGAAKDGGAAKDAGGAAPMHDAAASHDAGREPTMEDDDESTGEGAVKDAGRDSGTKKDAGSKKDAGASEADDDDDDDDDKEGSGGGSDEGCAAAGPHASSPAWLLFIIGIVTIRRRRASTRPHRS